MNSFRFKLGVLLAIIAGAFIVSQVVYRNTITSMHDAVYSAVDTLEIVHRAEDFHSSTHMMLYLASRYWERKDEKTYKEYEAIRESARNTIDALSKSGEPGGNQHHTEETFGRPAGDLRSVFHAFAAETDAVFSGADRETSTHLEKARNLFDDIFRNKLTVIHDYHEVRLVSLKTGAHEGKKITASFGIASFPDDGIGKFTAFLKKADERLYLAKTSGRNRVVC